MKTRLDRTLSPVLLALVLCAPALMHPTRSLAQVSVDISANTPPPELPVYDQPPVPADGYIWTPGYWYWDDDIQDYYWVPGTWVPAPQPDYLWTPGYWGTDGAVFLWHAGYWGPQVGFYGGVNYGYGYGGNGYEGGYWQGGRLYYNRSVNNISNVQITNVYNKTVINDVTINRVSYNGGNGIHAEATPAQLAAANERHIPATQLQQQHVQMARNTPALRAAQNNGRPPIAATSKATVFSGGGVVRARNSQTARPIEQSHPIAPEARQRAPEQQRTAPEQRAPAEQRAPGAPPPEPAEPHRATPPHAPERAPEHQGHEEDHEHH